MTNVIDLAAHRARRDQRTRPTPPPCLEPGCDAPARWFTAAGLAVACDHHNPAPPVIQPITVHAQ